MNRPWMPWYIADYLADTAHLRAAQSGAYLHLIMHYWQRGGLPSDNVQLAAIARMSDAEWKKARPIIEPFFQMPGWKHKRVEEELAKAQAKYEARAAAGKRGGEAKAEAKQNPSNATANDIAGLYQPQPQLQSPSNNPDSEMRESNSPTKNFDVIEGGAIAIDETYEPSDRATEYAFSLGMKKADLTSELSKFKAMSVATRAVSFNPDMSFKVWCDRWLDHKRKHNPDFKPDPEPEVPAAPVEPYELVVEGTPEAAAWAMHNREKGLRPLFFCKQVLPSGAIATGARCKTLFPPGYDEATGEKLQPKSDEAAA